MFSHKKRTQKLVEAIKKETKPFMVVSFSIIIYALFANLLSWQFRLVSGGFVGYGLLISYLTSWPVGLLLLIINTILIGVAFITSGKGMGLRVTYGYILISVAIDFFRNVLALEQSQVLLVDKILFTSLFGVIGGITIGTVVHYKYGVGGYTLIFHIINSFKKVSAPKLFLILDIVLGTLSWLFFGWQTALGLMTNSVVFYFAMKWTMNRF